MRKPASREEAGDAEPGAAGQPVPRAVRSWEGWAVPSGQAWAPPKPELGDREREDRQEAEGETVGARKGSSERR